MIKKIAFWLGAMLLVAGGITGLLGYRGGSQETPEIQPLPEELDSITYTHAQQIVELARGFTETKRDLEALQAELAARGATVAMKED
jgi:hypothetical protein